MKAVLWPERRGDDARVAVRIGRVIHWIMVSVAVLGAVLSVYVVVDSYRAANASIVDHARWTKQNPPLKLVNGKSVYQISARDGHVYEIEGATDASREQAVEYARQANIQVEDEPIVVAFDWTFALILFVGACLTAMIGRALRYVIAGE